MIKKIVVSVKCCQFSNNGAWSFSNWMLRLAIVSIYVIMYKIYKCTTFSHKSQRLSLVLHQHYIGNITEQKGNHGSGPVLSDADRKSHWRKPFFMEAILIGECIYPAISNKKLTEQVREQNRQKRNGVPWYRWVTPSSRFADPVLISPPIISTSNTDAEQKATSYMLSMMWNMTCPLLL